ncbi:plasmid pRiA4b ORF-3 family protein [Jiella sonneratiae]|uniref:plasmid pRiA4b ORF-3 family protein n=1 Tax=Jiella sonneratiae TaxID=2816856 RepID=UPI003159DFFC
MRELAYTYDFGDDWRHTILIESVDEADPAVEYPRFIEGQHRVPPEDVGGLPGFELFLDAIADPNHEDHDHLMRWSGGAFDPRTIDLDDIRKRVAKLARRRTVGKAAFAKSQNRIN